MGQRDYYSFSNDLVMEHLGIPKPERNAMIGSADEIPDGMDLGQAIKEFYPLEYDDPRTAIDAALNRANFETPSAGITLLFVGNGYEVPDLVLSFAIEWLGRALSDEENLRKWGYPEKRARCIHEELLLLIRTLCRRSGVLPPVPEIGIF